MGTKVLIVDDDPLMHKLYQHHLERAGFQVVTAANGMEGLELAQREIPQVIVMDMMMPEMDGLSALRELRRYDTTKSIPVIMITANAEYYTFKKEAEYSGAAVFLTKPFSPAKLITEVNRVISGQNPAA